MIHLNFAPKQWNWRLNWNFLVLYHSWPPQLLSSVKGAGASLTEISSCGRDHILIWSWIKLLKFQTACADQNILLIIHDCQIFLALLLMQFLLYWYHCLMKLPINEIAFIWFNEKSKKIKHWIWTWLQKGVYACIFSIDNVLWNDIWLCNRLWK